MEQSRRPRNVIVILTDDLGWGELGCYGATDDDTPAIDALAVEGAIFTDAHATSSLCTPSRYSLLTGRHAWRSPLRYGVLAPHGPAIIERDRPTLASVLRNAGFTTGAFGKWHLGLGWRRRDGRVDDAFRMPWRDLLWDGRKPSIDTGADVDYTAGFVDGPLDRGFDRFFGISGSLDMPPYCFLSDRAPEAVPTIPRSEFESGQRSGYMTADWMDSDVDLRFVREATSWLAEHAEERKFLYLATSAPHRPHVAPEFLRGTSANGPRGDALRLVDWMVAQVMTCLNGLGQLDESLIVFSSDNGAPRPRDGEARAGYSPNGALRGQKADVWEGGHREPLVIRWPGVVPPGTVIDVPVSLSDILPTIADVIEEPIAGPLDGRSLLPLLLGGQEDSERVFIYQGGQGVFAVRQGSTKAVFTSGSGGYSDPAGEPRYPGDDAGQLYDLATDMTEARNLWNDRADAARRLYSELVRSGARLRPEDEPSTEGEPS